MTATRVDMSALAREAEEEAGATAAIIGDPPAAQEAPRLLRQVFENLLSNAVKFSRGWTSPRIEIGGVREGDRVRYFVKDNGVGFDMAHAGKLFGVFQRLHPGDEFEGTGIGLAIVDRIVRRHGGRAWAESRPGQGATFYFTLGAAPGDEGTGTQDFGRV